MNADTHRSHTPNAARKKRRTKKALVAFSLLAVLVVAAGAIAGDRHDGRHGGHFGGPMAMHHLGDPSRMVNRMARFLDLDDLQRQEIENALLARQPAFEALKDRGRAVREGLEALDPAAADYATSLDTLATERGRIVTEMTLLGVTLKQEIHAMLTDEQRVRLEEGKERMKARFRERMERLDEAGGVPPFEAL